MDKRKPAKKNYTQMTVIFGELYEPAKERAKSQDRKLSDYVRLLIKKDLGLIT
jgi:hypothetical protein